MLGDAQLDACEAQMRSFRIMTGQHYETLQEILRNYETLVEDYRILKSDYEEEKENREKYKRQARGQEKNPFVLLLVDGDGYIFKDHLIKNVREGGISAAQLLSAEIRDRLRKLCHLDHCRMVVRIYCNVAAISTALSKAGLVGTHVRALSPVVAAFNRTMDHFDFIDVGDNNGSVTSKVEETFRLFADSGQCKHIFFAGCHDTRYIPLLRPHLGKADKITLIKAAAHQAEFNSLGLNVEEFSSVFRDSAPAGWSFGTTAIKGAANKKTPSESVAAPLGEANDFPDYNGVGAASGASRPNSINDDRSESVASSKTCPHYMRKDSCKFGNRCKGEHPNKRNDNPEGPKPKTQSTYNAFADDWRNKAIAKAPDPTFADDWGTSSKKAQLVFADGWVKDQKDKNSLSQSQFADDWGHESKLSTTGIAEGWGNGPQHNSKTASLPNQGVVSRTQKSTSVSELSVGSRNQEETKPHPADVLRSSGSSDAPGPPQVKEPPQVQERPQLQRKLTSAFTTAADLPRPSPETEGLIPINKYGDRLDFYLSRPTQEECAAYNTMAKEPGRKPCNDYQLKGHCPSLAAGLDCGYDHKPLSTELFHILKVIIQGYPCPKQGACRNSDCFNGHVCQRPGCRGMDPCKFKNNYRAHNVDPKVAEWVPAVDLEERESGDAASITMGSAVQEPKVNSVAPNLNPESMEWHPESAAWNPEAADWTPAVAD